MKKYFLSIVALAAMLFATSCQESLVEPQMEGPTTFTVQLPDQMGTKAEIGSANTVNQLFVSVYAPGCKSTPLSSAVVEKAEGDGTFTVSFNLIQDQTYDLIFWAQTTNAYVDKSQSEDATYDLRTIDIADRFYSNEEGAAFYAYQTYVIDGKPKEAILKRPFAQLNIGTTVESLKTDADSDIILEGAKIEVKHVASSFNTVTGFGEGDGTTIYGQPLNFMKVAGEGIQVNNQKYAKLEVGGKSYVYVTMDYLPIISSETVPKDLVEIKLLIDTDQPTAIEHTFSSVPVQRNYRTNIVGNLISSTTDFNVVVDDKFDGELPASEEEKLQMAAQVGGEYTLTDDIVLSSPLMVRGNFELNLGDYTISNPNDYVIENYADLTISAANNGGLEGMGTIRSHKGKITIKGGKYTASSDWKTGTYQHILKAENTEVVINDGIFDATIGGITNAMFNASENGIITINGGTFRNVEEGTVIPQFAPYMFTYEKNGKLIINDGDFYGGWRFNGETATTDIYGGTFTVSYDGQSFHANSTHVLTIYGGVFSLENGGKLNPANHLADGYKVIEKGDKKYYVVENDVDIVVENNADIKTQLAAAIQNGETEIIIDAAGNNIGALKDNYKLTQALVPAGTEVTIKNAMVEGTSYGNGANGHVIFENCVFTNSGAYSIHFDNGSGKVTFKNCILYGWNSFGGSLTSVSFYDSELYGNGTYALIRSYADLRLENCYFDITKADHQDVYSEGVEVTSGVEMQVFNCEWVVSNQEQLVNAATNSSKVYLTDGDYDLKGIQKDGLTLIGIGENVKVANTTNFASGSSVGAIWKAINLENVTITNTVFTMDEGSNATFKNVYFEAGVRQAYGNNVKFESCSFGSNSEGYALHFQTDANDNGNITIDRCQFKGGKVHLGGKRTYDFKECNFEAGTDFQVWSNITLENCSVEGTIVTSANITELFPKLDTSKVTIK